MLDLEIGRAVLRQRDVERQRIARELHDVIGQALTSVRLNLEASRRRTSDPEGIHRLVDSLDAVDLALAAVRTFARDLRPTHLGGLGLAQAVRSSLRRRAAVAGYVPVLIVKGDLRRLDPAIATACSRIVHEALTNVDRHARARHVRVELAAQRHALHAIVRDDGIGFRPPADDEADLDGLSLGLLGMAERAALVGGRITIESTPGEGTTVTACLPIDPRVDPQPLPGLRLEPA